MRKTAEKRLIAFLIENSYHCFVTCRIPTRIRIDPKSKPGVSGSFRKSAPANMEQKVVREPNDDSFTTDILPAA